VPLTSAGALEAHAIFPIVGADQGRYFLGGTVGGEVNRMGGKSFSALGSGALA